MRLGWSKTVCRSWSIDLVLILNSSEIEKTLVKELNYSLNIISLMNSSNSSQYDLKVSNSFLFPVRIDSSISLSFSVDMLQCNVFFTLLNNDSTLQVIAITHFILMIKSNKCGSLSIPISIIPCTIAELVPSGIVIYLNSLWFQYSYILSQQFIEISCFLFQIFYLVIFVIFNEHFNNNNLNYLFIKFLFLFILLWQFKAILFV